MLLVLYYSVLFFLTQVIPTAQAASSLTISVNASLTTDNTSAYWYEAIRHQGVAPFDGNSSYAVYRNVKDYGAKGEL